MKVIAINRNAGEAVANPPHVTLYPSSALIHGGKPFFLPDFGGPWSVRPAVALRLCRLGKSIDARFARRYIDAMAPVAVFEPQAFVGDPGLAALVPAIDCTMAFGPWQELPDGEETVITMRWLDKEMTFTRAMIDAPAVIASLSRYMTIQMGDALIPFGIPAMAAPVETESTFTLTLGDAPPFDIRVK